MRRLITIASTAVLALAACTSAATPTSQPPPSSITPEPAESTPLATATSPEPLQVRVTFDGKACVYEGPTVFLDGTKVRFEFEPTADTQDLSGFVVGPVKAGISRDKVRDDLRDHPAHEVPAWIMSYEASLGPGSLTWTISSTQSGQPVSGYMVACVTSPETTDATFFAELLLVAAG